MNVGDEFPVGQKVEGGEYLRRVQGDEYLLALKREPHKVKQLNKRS
jgi:hypothetical protein